MKSVVIRDMIKINIDIVGIPIMGLIIFALMPADSMI